MHLFLTGVLPFLAHNHAAAAAFLTCRHHNFHASIIPEFLSDEERVQYFCEARQQNELFADNKKQYKNLYYLFIQTPLMQFSPSLILRQNDCKESTLKRLLATKYFTRTLQRCCSFGPEAEVSSDLLQALSKVQSLVKLHLGISVVENEHLEIIINDFPSLEILSIQDAEHLKPVDPKTAINIYSPLPRATKTLRNLTLLHVGALFAARSVLLFPNLRKLELCGQDSSHELDLLPLSYSLTLLTDLNLENFDLKNTDSLKNLVHLSSLVFRICRVPDLSFLTQEDHLPHLTKLVILHCHGLSFASLAHAPNLCVLEVGSEQFDNDCLQYLENMVHLRKLRLSDTQITGTSGLFNTVMHNLHQLEQLNLSGCDGIGRQGAIAGALYSTHSRLRVLNLSFCQVVDHFLKGIGALKNTLEVLDLSRHWALSNEALVHCKDLVKLKSLKLIQCTSINDLSPLKDCLNLEDLDVSLCDGLTDDSFKIFSEEPNSFPNLRALDLTYCGQLTETVFEHLSKNNHLVYQLKELNVDGMGEISRNNICQLKGLRKLTGVLYLISDHPNLKGELMRRLKNLENIS